MRRQRSRVYRGSRMRGIIERSERRQSTSHRVPGYCRRSVNSEHARHRQRHRGDAQRHASLGNAPIGYVAWITGTWITGSSITETVRPRRDRKTCQRPAQTVRDDLARSRLHPRASRFARRWTSCLHVASRCVGVRQRRGWVASGGTSRERDTDPILEDPKSPAWAWLLWRAARPRACPGRRPCSSSSLKRSTFRGPRSSGRC